MDWFTYIGNTRFNGLDGPFQQDFCKIKRLFIKVLKERKNSNILKTLFSLTILKDHDFRKVFYRLSLCFQS